MRQSSASLQVQCRRNIQLEELHARGAWGTELHLTQLGWGVSGQWVGCCHCRGASQIESVTVGPSVGEPGGLRPRDTGSQTRVIGCHIHSAFSTGQCASQATNCQRTMSLPVLTTLPDLSILTRDTLQALQSDRSVLMS
jgi:hypothetical protein